MSNKPNTPSSGGDYSPQIFHSLGEIKGLMSAFREEQGVQNSRLDGHDTRISALEAARTSAQGWLKGTSATIAMFVAWVTTIVVAGAWLFEKVVVR